ncbi:MAG TPA: hypothetical protein VF240_16745 [Pyrinomonadaceae bacterium]
MSTSHSGLRVLSLILLASASALAQEPAAPARPRQSAAITITATATERGLRFAAVGPVRQTRLEVYDASGARVFDSDFLPGNVRDWAAPEQGDDRDGAYTCVLTARDLMGRFSVKQAAVLVEGGRAALSLGEAEPSGGVGASRGEAAGAATLSTHDGRDGAVTATAGDLTLRTGDILAGKDEERMRVTAEGRVGVGTDKPEATLDVAGEVRARDGFRFSDGSRLTISDAGALVRLSSDGTPLPGWGTRPETQAGALADTVVDGDLVFTNPGFPNYGRDIRLSDNLGGVRIYGAPSLSASPAGAAIQFFGNGHALFPGQAYVDAGAHNSAAVIFRSAPTGGTIAERMRVTSAGNVGIGTNDPQAKLHVNGTVNFTGLRTQATYVPNIIGGNSSNAVTAGILGATIGGGGHPDAANRVTDIFGTVGGGVGNRAGNNAGTTEDAYAATVSGGDTNTASGPSSTVGGGTLNHASGLHSTIPGGSDNRAQGLWSFAAGTYADSQHDGSFVWSDSTRWNIHTYFSSTAPNQFLINATGGVGIGTNAPGARLHVSGGAILLDNNQGLFLKNTSGAQKRALLGDPSNILRVGSGGSQGFDEIRFDVGSFGEAMAINASGNVGVGTISPQRKLHVSDAMRLQPIASPPASPASGDLYFDTSEALCVYVSGAWAKLAGPGACQ